MSWLWKKVKPGDLTSVGPEGGGRGFWAAEGWFAGRSGHCRLKGGHERLDADFSDAAGVHFDDGEAAAFEND